MPGGEFIPNGSMHWSIDHEATIEYEHRPRPGGGKWKNFGHERRLCGVDRVNARPEALRVILRFKSRQDLNAAVAEMANPTQDGNLLKVEFTLPVDWVDEAQLKDAPPDPLAPVRVEWGPDDRRKP